jgi:predicted SAM-dependent methyltransferase
MIPRCLKALYYKVMRLPMRCNGSLYRRLRAPRDGVVRVHLGPGRERYIDKWINVDANLFGAKIDVWADLRNPLPFPDASVDAFYSHHVVEHLPEDLLPFHFAQMHRCLKPGGVIRIAGPDADVAMRKYLENDHSWFGDWPVSRKSIGGRFSNFVLCRGEHLSILTTSYLRELMDDAGFVNPRECRPTSETGRPDLIGNEVLEKETLEPCAEAPFTIVVEAERVAP